MYLHIRLYIWTGGFCGCPAAFKKVVGPAVKREAVAHLKAGMGLSERRACCLVDADRSMIRYQSRRAPDGELRQRLCDLANERRRSAIGVCLSCCAVRVNPRASTTSTGFTGRKGWGFASAAPAAEPWERGHPLWWKPSPMPGGRWISFMINSPMGGGFGFSTSSMM